MAHEPVLLAEIVTALAPVEDATIVDATFGGGGYTRALLAAGAARVIGIDRDPDAKGRLGDLAHEPRFALAQGCFGDLDQLVHASVDGIVFDLGVSSFQIDEAERGFSFQADGPLDMRMGQDGPSAADAVNHLSEGALIELFNEYGEENDSRRIARAIVQARAAHAFETTAGLASLVERAVGGRRGERTHPATRVFQALRMLVNDELGELARGLSAAERMLAPGGRLVTVSFHSLEDRLVKRFISDRAGLGGEGSRHMPSLPSGPALSFKVEKRRAVMPSEDEVKRNPRARSATLRVAVRTDAPAWADVETPPLAANARAEWSRMQ